MRATPQRDPRRRDSCRGVNESQVAGIFQGSDPMMVVLLIISKSTNIQKYIS